MSHVNKMWIVEHIFAFSKERYFYSTIQKHCDAHGAKISMCKISNIINWKGKINKSLRLHGKTPNEFRKKIYTVPNLSKVKILLIRENPPKQKT